MLTQKDLKKNRYNDYVYADTHTSLKKFTDQEEVVERVKARLQEEGREARNLVAYSLPLQDQTKTKYISSSDCSKFIFLLFLFYF